MFWILRGLLSYVYFNFFELQVYINIDMLSATKSLVLVFIISIAQCGEIAYQGLEGDWHPLQSAEKDYYLCGAQMRFDIENFMDFTAASGMKFVFCNLHNWAKQNTLAHDGLWGYWQEKVMCPQDSFVNGFQVKSQISQGIGDDTSLNGLRFSCLHKDNQITTKITVYPGAWGEWEQWVIPARDNIYIHSFAVRYQPNQRQNDDTAMNGFAFYFDDVKVISYRFQYNLQKKVDLIPTIVQRKIINNNSSSNIHKGLSVTIEETLSQSWTNSQSFEFGLSIQSSFQAEVPFADVSGSLKVGVSETKQFKLGKETSTKQAFEKSLVYQCMACHTCIADFSFLESNQDVEYILHVNYENGMTVGYPGRFSGAVASQLSVQRSDIPIPQCYQRYKKKPK